MNQAIAKTKYVRISPRKARYAADLIRGLSVEAAALQLIHSNLKGGRLLKKTLDSAVANAETQMDVKKEKLKVAEVRVDPGPTIKRSRSRNRGSRASVLKRTSHFTVIVSEE